MAEKALLWLKNFINCGKNTIFLSHILNYRLYHQVTIGKIGQLERAMQACLVLVYLTLSDLAFACQHLPRLMYACHTLVEQLLFYLAHDRFVTGLRTGLGDTTAHQATTGDANPSYSHRLYSLSTKAR